MGTLEWGDLGFRGLVESKYLKSNDLLLKETRISSSGRESHVAKQHAGKLALFEAELELRLAKDKCEFLPSEVSLTR